MQGVSGFTCSPRRHIFHDRCCISTKNFAMLLHWYLEEVNIFFVCEKSWKDVELIHCVLGMMLNSSVVKSMMLWPCLCFRVFG